MKAVFFKAVVLLVLLSMFVFPQQAIAQVTPAPGQSGDAPELQPVDGSGGAQDVDLAALGLRQAGGQWYADSSEVSRSLLNAESTGQKVQALGTGQKSDAWGYTVRPESYPWMDIAGTPDKVFDLKSSGDQTVTLPFPFDFYGHTYSSVRMTPNGYMVLGDSPFSTSSSMIPYPAEPNNVIAPYWVPADTSVGYVMAGGDAPYRWIGFQWHITVSDLVRINNIADYDDLTFQALLYETGGILFQTGTMNDNVAGNKSRRAWRCAQSGIEDSTGTVGLVTRAYCQEPASSKTYLYAPPTALTARIGIFPLDYGEFASPTTPAVYRLTIENPGTMGYDTYNLAVRSRWPITLYDSDGVTALSDTNADSKIDTGPVPLGGSKEIVVTVKPSANAVVGMTDAAKLTITSTLNSKKSMMVNLQTTIPASFVQSYITENWLTNADVSLSLNEPDGQTTIATDPASDGFEAAVLQTPEGNVFHAWRQCTNNCSINNLYYSVVDASGNPVLPKSQVENVANFGATSDSQAALAVTGGGKVGMVWLQNYTMSPIRMAIYDQNGSVLVAPFALATPWPDPSYTVSFSSPKIAGLPNNRFALAWRVFATDPTTTTQYTNIWFAVVDDQGAYVVAPTRLTNDPGNGEVDYDPTIEGLAGGRVLIAWANSMTKGGNVIRYLVLNGDGSLFQRDRLPVGTAIVTTAPDAAMLSNGQVLLAWSTFKSNKTQIAYAVLNARNYKKNKGPVTLKIPAGALTGAGNVSVAADASEHGILTWMDADSQFGRHLYYALIGENGTLLTKPVIFKTAADTQRLETSASGQGITSSNLVNVTWFVGLGTGSDAAQVPVEQGVVDAYNVSQNTTHVNLEVAPFQDAKQILADEIAAGTPPDVIGPVGWAGSNAFNGQYLNLNPYISKTKFDTSVFDASVLSVYQTTQGTFGMPFAVYPSAFLYNRALFDAAGLSHPPAKYGEKYKMPDGTMVDWTWDTVAQIAQLLTVDANGNNATESGFDRSIIEQYGYTWQMQSHPNYWGTYFGSGSLLVPVSKVGAYKAQIPAAWKSAWQWTYNGVWGPTPFIATNSVEQSAYFGGGNPFNSGKFAMAEVPFWATCCLANVNTWEWAAMPTYNGKVNGRIDMDTFRILKGSKHPDQAFQFLTYLVTSGVDPLILGTPGNPPAYGAIPAIVSKRQAFLDARKQQFPWVQNWDILMEGLKYPDVPPAESWMPNFINAWNRVQDFGTLLTTTGNLDLTTQVNTLQTDLQTIFNTKP